MAELDDAQRQITVFGAERMAKLAGHEADSQSIDQLINAVEALAFETGNTEHHRSYQRSFYRSIGKPLVLQVNPEDVHGMGSTEVDRAFATAYNLKAKTTFIIIPRRNLRPGIYEETEDMYIDRERRAKIYKSFVPLYGNVWREIAARFTSVIDAVKLASDDEVQDALHIISHVALYNGDEGSAEQR